MTLELTMEQIFYSKLDTILQIESSNGRLLKQENELITIDKTCRGGCIFAEFTFAILKGGTIALFWESEPEFWEFCDNTRFTSLLTPKLEEGVKEMITTYLDQEATAGIEEDMADLRTSQKIEARKFKEKGI